MSTESIVVFAVCFFSFLVIAYWALYRNAYRTRFGKLKTEAELKLRQTEKKLKPLFDRYSEEVRKLTPSTAGAVVPVGPNLDVHKKGPSSTAPINESYFPSYLPSTLDSAQYLVSAIENYQAVSHEFVTAVGQMAHQHFESGLELSAYLRGLHENTGTLSWMFSDIPKGTLDSLKGHLGEQVIGKAFEEAGNNTVFPLNGSNPGWDLLINGQEVQVKTVQNFKAVWEHLDKYPDIPVLVSGEASGIPEDVPHLDLHQVGQLANFEIHPGDVIAMDGLSPDTALQSVTDGIDGAEGSGVDAHLPWVTLIMSTYREINLLSNGHTDLASSVQNSALDVAGQGGGAAVGAKAGAVVGSVGGPIGIGIGLVVGGLVGGFMGRAVTNSIKYAKANEAQEKVQEKVDQLPKTIASLTAKMKGEVHQQSDSANEKIHALKKASAQEYLNRKSEIALACSLMEKMFSEQLRETTRKFCNQYLKRETRPLTLNPFSIGERNAERDFFAAQVSRFEGNLPDINVTIQTASLSGVSAEIIAQGVELLLKRMLMENINLSVLGKRLSQKIMASSLNIGKGLQEFCESAQTRTRQAMRKEIQDVANTASQAAAEWRKVGEEKQANALTALESKLIATAEQTHKDVGMSEKTPIKTAA
jgi:hypothetical protein